MFETIIDAILIWWLLPVILVWLIFYAMIRADDTSIGEMDDTSFNLLVVLSVVWPLGVIAIITFIVDYVMQWFGERS